MPPFLTLGRPALRGVVFVLLFGCGGSQPSTGTPATAPAHAAAPPECVEIAKRCHKADATSPTAHECHVFAHGATSADACVARRAECLAACPES